MENLKIRKVMALILIITILMINSLNLLNGIVVAYDENQEVQEDDRFNQLIENIVNRIPDDLLTDKHKIYIIMYLKRRRNILLSIK